MRTRFLILYGILSISLSPRTPTTESYLVPMPA